MERNATDEGLSLGLANFRTRSKTGSKGGLRHVWYNETNRPEVGCYLFYHILLLCSSSNRSRPIMSMTTLGVLPTLHREFCKVKSVP